MARVWVFLVGFFFPPVFPAKQMDILELDTTKFCLHASLAVVSFSRVELTELAMIFQ